MVREQVQHQTNGQCFRVQHTVRCTEGKFRVERGGVINDDRIGDRVTGDKLNAMGWQPVLDNVSHKLWIDDQRDLVVGLQPPRRVGFTMRQEAAVTRDGRLIIPSVATSRPCERGWLRTDVDRDAVADHRVLWHFRWREAVALHDDAAPSEGSTGEQQRAGRRGWVSFPCRLVDEQVFAGLREGFTGGPSGLTRCIRLTRSNGV